MPVNKCLCSKVQLLYLHSAGQLQVARVVKLLLCELHNLYSATLFHSLQFVMNFFSHNVFLSPFFSIQQCKSLDCNCRQLSTTQLLKNFK